MDKTTLLGGIQDKVKHALSLALATTYMACNNKTAACYKLPSSLLTAAVISFKR